MKGIGCLAIVLHHLAFYGPMSDVVRGAAPLVMDWLFYYARLAVQMFFVLAGYLVAAQLAPDGHASNTPTVSLIWKRYKRLVTPFLFAVALATLRFHHTSSLVEVRALQAGTANPVPTDSNARSA